jgi:7-cyano-7-deazaguanine reductase
VNKKEGYIMEFKLLQKKDPATASKELEMFAKPAGVQMVKFDSPELCSVCPVTGQPDISRVIIEYWPKELCIESKSLKHYLWSFRDQGIFGEALAAQIAKDLAEATGAERCHVTLIQNVRGGIQMTVEAEA